MYFHTLRAADVARQEEWTGGLPSDLIYSSNELAGEIGEIQELLFEGPPRDFGPVKSDPLAWLDKLADELADGIICVDLLAIAADLPEVEYAVSDKPGILTPRDLGLALGAVTGAGVCNTVKKIERERRGWVGSRATPEQLHTALVSLSCIIARIASLYAVDLGATVSAKFNKTSEKYGLVTRLAAPGEAS